MKTNFYSLWKKIINPPIWVKIIVFVLTIITATLSIIIVVNNFESELLKILSYALFGVTGVLFAYSVCLIIPLFPKMKRGIVAWMEKHDFTYLLLRSFGFRTVIFAIGSFFMSVLFGGFNAYMGIANRSIWYGSLSAFYISLAFLRGGVLIYYKNKVGKREQTQSDHLLKAKIYRNSGVITLVLNVALSVAITQMIFSNAHFFYMGLTIFAYAAYAFYKITISVITFVKAHKQKDLTIMAIRNINLVDALVSILALQTALLATFSDGTFNVSLMNTITGIVISLTCVGIGIYMIISANNKIKQIKKGNIGNEQSI